MKHLIKIVYLIAVFVAALLFFGSKMTETLSDEQVELTEIQGCKLPLVSFECNGAEVNRLYGYTSALDTLSVRENFISLEQDNAINLVITERETNVRKLLYNVYDTFDGERVAHGEVNAFDYTETGKKARIKLDHDMVYSREYAAEVVLITSESRRIYYYFRFKQYDNAYFNEKIKFILDFSNKTREKDIDFVIPYLDSTYRGEGTTYSHVDISDSYYMVCWGDLEPRLISDIKISVRELYKYLMVATLDYTVSLETESGTETYLVSEKYRINLGSSYCYLLNYERDMEAMFDPALASISMDQLKLGISARGDVDIFSTSDNSMMCFVRNNTLYYYNLAENTVINVFSMDKGSKAPSEVNDRHEIRILRMDENGDTVFMVAGYFNNGEYEGKTGILLYEYYRSENRIKELVYIPIAETYDHMKTELGDFAYLNTSDVFYFTAYDALYSYNITTGALLGLSEAGIVASAFCREDAYFAWQEAANPTEVFILYPEKDSFRHIRSEEYDIIILFDHIGKNMVLGYGYSNEIAAYSDGTPYYPLKRIRILDGEEALLKDYSVDGVYIVDAEATDTSLRLTRVAKDEEGTGYKPISDDYILIRNEKERESFSVDTRITQKMMDEYYLSLPYGYYLNSLPQTDVAGVTIIKTTTTVRVDVLDAGKERYEVYSYGNILGTSTELKDAIKLADSIETIGVVTDNRGYPVWERGITNKTSEVSPETVRSGREYMDKTEVNSISLTGATLDQVLYYIYRDEIIYAMTDNETTIQLTGYTPFFVTFVDPATGQEESDTIDDLREKLRLNGNVFWVVYRY